LGHTDSLKNEGEMRDTQIVLKMKERCGTHR